jgi:hypothetical protein
MPQEVASCFRATICIFSQKSFLPYVLIDVQMLTDLIVYDWWELILGFAADRLSLDSTDLKATCQYTWIQELMAEKHVRALPRSMQELGRCYDSREFWATFNMVPIRSRVH